MATNLLTPKTTTPNGVPPKNILAFLALGVLITIGFGAIYLGESETSAAEADAKKATLQDATSTKDLGVKGDPKDISRVADKAGIPAALRAESPSVPASAPRAGDLPTAPGVGQAGPLPMPLGTAATVAAQGSQNSIDSVRDTEIANAKPIVADYGAAGSAEPGNRSATDSIESLIAAQRSDSAQRAADLAKATDPSKLAGLMSGGAPGVKTSSNARDSDKAFLKQFSTSRREDGIRPSLPEAPLMVAQGSSIEAVTIRSINSDLPGVITARTVRDIYDTTTVSRVVIPRGSMVIGEYSSDVRMGQSRLLFGFTRLVLPDGQSFDLNGFGGSDAQGRSGLQAEVDNHYFRLFGTSLMIGLLADRVVRRDVVPQGGSNGQGGGGLTATGQILTETARSILEANRETSPTLTIPAGSRVLIEVRRDMIFPSAYRG